LVKIKKSLLENLENKKKGKPVFGRQASVLSLPISPPHKKNKQGDKTFTSKRRKRKI
jgi:hypothetical protein